MGGRDDDKIPILRESDFFQGQRQLWKLMTLFIAARRKKMMITTISLAVSVALESLQQQLSTLQVLQQQYPYERESTLAEIDHSRLILLKTERLQRRGLASNK